MGLFDRFSKLLRSELNQLLDKAEDPKKLSDLQALELEESKKKAEKLLVQTMGKKAIAERNLKLAEDKALTLLAQAEDLLKAGQEDQAREILEKKQNLDLEIAQYKEEIAISQQSINIIQKGLPALEQKIKELRSIASSEADIDQRPFDTFSRMEEKIEQKESQVIALKELCEQEEKNTPKASLTTKSTPNLEEELEALKQKIKNKQ